MARILAYTSPARGHLAAGFAAAGGAAAAAAAVESRLLGLPHHQARPPAGAPRH